jgi:hypothetical protein
MNPFSASALSLRLVSATDAYEFPVPVVLPLLTDAVRPFWLVFEVGLNGCVDMGVT